MFPTPRIAFAALLVALQFAATTQAQQKKEDKPRRPTPPFRTLQDERSYAIGVNIGRSIKEDNLKLNLEVLVRGLRDVLGDGKLSLTDKLIEENLNNINAEMAERFEQLAKANLDKARAYLEQNKKKGDVVSTRSGLQYRVIKAGRGPSPNVTDIVRVHYVGKLIDGSEFDNSRKRAKDPAELRVNGVIPGWTEALQKMRVGDKWQLFVPPELGYGGGGFANLIGPNELLIFEIELLEIDQVEEAPAKSDK